MSRRRKVVLTIIPTLLLLGLLLLAACDFNPPPPPAKKEPSKGAATQETTSSPGTNASPGDRADDASVPSAGGATGDTTPPAGDAAQKVAPWSDPEDYEYYYNILPISGSDIEVKKVLRHQIIPQAVKSLLATFPKTFGYLEDWAIGLGMNVTYNTVKPTLEATFELSPAPDSDPTKSGHSTYGLMINTASPSIDLPPDGTFDDFKRRNLEALCVHELMHGLMFETLTCGMYGLTPDGVAGDEFPLWFKEGAAEAACGGIERNRDFIRELNKSNIKSRLQEQTLTNAQSTRSSYTVGWFAVMYLAYLTKNKESLDPAVLADGLDIFLLEINKGTSLSDAIKLHSKKYDDLEAFERGFVVDDDAADFILQLIAKIGDGRGSLVAGDYAVTDLLPDANGETMLFWVHFTYPYTALNKYGEALDSYELLEGGSARKTGVPGANHRDYSPEPLE